MSLVKTLKVSQAYFERPNTVFDRLALPFMTNHIHREKCYKGTILEYSKIYPLESSSNTSLHLQQIVKYSDGFRAPLYDLPIRII